MPEAQYGSWASPLSAAQLAAGKLSFGDIALTAKGRYWIENRPDEAGRAVIVMARDNGCVVDCLPAPFNARTSVNEYGGGAFCVAEPALYFVNFTDQCLWRIDTDALDSPPHQLTDPDPNRRFADLLFDPHRQRIIAVCETHPDAEDAHEARHTLVAISANRPPQVLADGADFYASAALSPNGDQLAWLQWQHPQMPWDGTELWLAQIDPNGQLVEPRRVCGGEDESVFQPQWSPDGRLHYVSDKTDWWNLYRLGTNQCAQALWPKNAEFGLPQWVFGMSTYGFDADGTMICCFRQNGQSVLAQWSEDRGNQVITSECLDIERLRVNNGRALFATGFADRPSSIVEIDLRSQQRHIHRSASTANIDLGYLSLAEPLEFHSAAGRTAYAFYYPPRNHDFSVPSDSRPPLLVNSHGGPSAATSPAFDLKVQYWTSRGFAVVDVNYGGSTGYGRPYRRSLYGQWGIVDVEDCIAAAQHLVERGLADPQRCAVRGSSAGGYTTLAALTFSDKFQAGASYYGISDLAVLAQDTHKFESRYLDQLIGPYPQEAATYRARSPIYHREQLNAPIIFFQGEQDKVVPPNQAERMVQALDERHLPVALILFREERHGFRQAANIQRAIEAELYFYGKIFGFVPADSIEPVTIRNLEEV